jgi:hypothetical protein
MDFLFWVGSVVIPVGGLATVDGFFRSYVNGDRKCPVFGG